MNKIQSLLTVGLIAISAAASAYEYHPPRNLAESLAQEWIYQAAFDGVVAGCRETPHLNGANCQVVGTAGSEIQNGFRRIVNLQCSYDEVQERACRMVSEDWRPMGN